MHADDSTLFSVSPDSSNSSRTDIASQRSQNLERVLSWGDDWLVTSNSKSTHLFSLTGPREDVFLSFLNWHNVVVLVDNDSPDCEDTCHMSASFVLSKGYVL